MQISLKNRQRAHSVTRIYTYYLCHMMNIVRYNVHCVESINSLTKIGNRNFYLKCMRDSIVQNETVDCEYSHTVLLRLTTELQTDRLHIRTVVIKTYNLFSRQ